MHDWSNGRSRRGRPVRMPSRRRLPPCTPMRPTAAATDWAEIVGLYDVLSRADPSPVIELNRAVAVAMRDGPAAGLVLVEAILDRGDLQDYRLAHAARAELCRRLGRNEGGAGLIRTRAIADASGTRAAISRAPDSGVVEIRRPSSGTAAPLSDGRAASTVR